MESDISSYKKWCKREKLPQDAISKKIYTEYVKSIPSLEDIIDLIRNGYIHQAYEKLSIYVQKQEDMINRR